MSRCFKMAGKNEFYFGENSHVSKIRKTTFLKEFFNKFSSNLDNINTFTLLK